ncbi:hypothetical protein [Clostridium ihumii]|uniref:hypothetical protein n=1 Tax=Clostridium ihumii TaxID=1470356 RepID=UPI0005532AAA|nr:hypothetical protein [Clostridium ihumii]
MIYKINSNENINWNAKNNEKIIQNVRNILNIIKFELPYARDMGRDPKNLDVTLDINKYDIVEETYDLIEKYEPRAIVKDVNVSAFNNGPVIEVVIQIAA